MRRIRYNCAMSLDGYIAGPNDEFDWDGSGGAHMTYYDHPGGGGVFSVGSIAFGGSLVVDPFLQGAVRNVLNRFLRR